MQVRHPPALPARRQTARTIQVLARYLLSVYPECIFAVMGALLGRLKRRVTVRGGHATPLTGAGP